MCGQCRPPLRIGSDHRRCGRCAASGKISCAELANESLKQIAAANPRLNAFITVVEESARTRAAELDAEFAGESTEDRCTGFPSHTRTWFKPRASAQPPDQKSSRISSLTKTPRLQRSSMKRARCYWERRDYTSSLMGPRPIIRTLVPFEIPGISIEFLADRAADRELPSRLGWFHSQPEQTPEDRFEFLRPTAERSG